MNLINDVDFDVDEKTVLVVDGGLVFFMCKTRPERHYIVSN